MIRNKWIALRGLGRSKGHWGSFQEEMRNAFPNDDIYFLDLPGNGNLNHKKSPLNVSNYIPFLENQLSDLSESTMTGRTYGIGLSLGGMIMTEWCLQNPKRFHKIFLINTSAGNLSKPWQRLSTPVLKSAIKSVLANDRRTLELNSLLMTTNLGRKKICNEFAEGLENNITVSKKFPIKFMNIFRQTLAAARYHFPLKFETSTVLIAGENDRFVNVSCSQAIQKRWNCQLDIHPTAGHDIAFEASEDLIRMISKHYN